MTEPPSRVPGPSRDTPGQKKEVSSSDVKPFRVDKVEEVPDEQKKKKKRRGQGIDASEEEIVQSAGTAAEPPLFTLEPKEKALSPMELQTPKTKAAEPSYPSPIEAVPPTRSTPREEEIPETPSRPRVEETPPAPREEKNKVEGKKQKKEEVAPKHAHRTHVERKEEKETYFKKIPAAEEKIEEPEEGTVPAPSPYVERGDHVPVKPEKKKEAGAPIEAVSPPAAAHPWEIETPPAPTPVSAPPYTRLHPEVLELFEKMVGVMTVATLRGEVKTTIDLSAPQFASSIFFGTQIIITEYESAPKQFNIEIQIPDNKALSLMQSNRTTLESAFALGNYNFKVHRVEVRSGGKVERRREKTTEVEKRRDENLP